jgi:DNA primase
MQAASRESAQLSQFGQNSRCPEELIVFDLDPWPSSCTEYIVHSGAECRKQLQFTA